MSTSSKWPQPVQAFEYPAVLTNGRAAAARKNEEDAALEAQAREQMLREDLTAGRSVSLILASVVTLGLLGLALIVLAGMPPL